MFIGIFQVMKQSLRKAKEAGHRKKQKWHLLCHCKASLEMRTPLAERLLFPLNFIFFPKLLTDLFSESALILAGFKLTHVFHIW